MKGHIRERSPGKWAIILDVRDPETGKRKRRWHSFRGNKRAAQIECARLISEQQGGTTIDPTRETVAAFLNRWLEHMKGQVSPRSHERYAELAQKNIAPALGSIAIAKLSPAHISAAYSKALTSGRRNGTGGLSARTVTHMHRVLRQALQQAVVWQVIGRNPADAVKPPKVERKEMPVLDTAESVDLIEALRGHSLFVPILLSTMTGLRRGEMTALRWKSVDLDRGQLAVVVTTEQTKAGCREKEPKAGRARTVALPALLVEELRQLRLRQSEGMLKLGVRLSGDHYVVAKADGTPYQPRSLTHAMRDVMMARGSKVRLHGLRHSHATHMLASGIHPKIASERLGHSKVGITLDLYSHVLPGMQEEAAARVDGLLRTALNGRRETKG